MKNFNTAYEYSTKSKGGHKKRAALTARAKNAFLLSMLLCLALAAAVMLIQLLMCRIALTQQNDLNVKLCAELDELNEENRHIAIEYEQMIDLGELEEYAKNELGMCTSAQKQTEVIETYTQDKAQIVKTDG